MMTAEVDQNRRDDGHIDAACDEALAVKLAGMNRHDKPGGHEEVYTQHRARRDERGLRIPSDRRAEQREDEIQKERAGRAEREELQEGNKEDVADMRDDG